MIKGVIFDLDGTLIDSMKIWYSIDRRFLRENGVTSPPDDISDRMKKLTVDESAEVFINEFHLSLSKPQVISRIEEMVREEYEQNIPLKPFAAEMAQYLGKKGILCGVATATYKNLAQAVLHRCGIDSLFRFILTDAEYPMGKRFPDIFLGGAKMLGCAPGETLVIEDSLHCIETAADAGFLTAGVYDEASAGDAEAIRQRADYYFNDLSDLKRLV